MTATPNAVKAAFIKEGDVFKENGIQYLDPILNIDDKKLLGAADVPDLGADSRPLGRRERARHRSRLQGL